MAKKIKQPLIEEVFEEKVEDVEYSSVMQKSYIDYSMSVITDRALPDARDGLKPVQRRILYDMYDLGATSDKPYRKCARVVGDTMGRFHPHGDSSIEGALVILAQDFKQSHPLIDGQGNFGNIEGDSHAASRYIECRLEKFTEDVFLSELKNDTVDFRPNYDETLKEPCVLPAKLPNFLLNGCEGIAVGMATSAPTHNLGELVDTCVYSLQHPKASNAELLNKLKGPDFPTGGIISNKSDLLDAYSSGSGKIKVRGKYHIEPDKLGKSKFVITEIPYTMIGEGINKFLMSVADLVENKTLSDITDISNQSNKEGIRIVLDLKKGADPDYIANVLYKKTRFEDTFSLNLLAVWNGRPATMSLVDIMQCYREFQYDIYARKFRRLLEKAEKQKEITEGLIKAIECIDTIVAVLRGSKNTEMARKCLMCGEIAGITFKTKALEKQALKLCFTAPQAQAILDMRLQRLVGLELNALEKELAKLNKDIVRYNKVLTSNSALTKEIVGELEELKKKYGIPRKTKLIDAGEVIIKEPEKLEEPCYILVDSKNYVHCIDLATYERNKEIVFNDFEYVIPSTTFSKLLFFTNIGYLHSIKVSDIPFGKYRDKGVPLDNISNFVTISEKIVYMNSSHRILGQLLFATKGAFIKRMDAKELEIARKSASCITLNGDDELVAVAEVKPSDWVVLGTVEKKYGRFKADTIPAYSRAAKGCIGAVLMDGDVLNEALVFPAGSDDDYVKKSVEIKRGAGKLEWGVLDEAEMKKVKRRKCGTTGKKK